LKNIKILESLHAMHSTFHGAEKIHWGPAETAFKPRPVLDVIDYHVMLGDESSSRCQRTFVITK